VEICVASLPTPCNLGDSGLESKSSRQTCSEDVMLEMQMTSRIRLPQVFHTVRTDRYNECKVQLYSLAHKSPTRGKETMLYASNAGILVEREMK
jgi:hypothetical protein